MQEACGFIDVLHMNAFMCTTLKSGFVQDCTQSSLRDTQEELERMMPVASALPPP